MKKKFRLPRKTKKIKEKAFMKALYAGKKIHVFPGNRTEKLASYIIIEDEDNTK